MNLRKARKIWWATARWHLYRRDVLNRAQTRFLRSMRLTPRMVAFDCAGGEVDGAEAMKARVSP